MHEAIATLGKTAAIKNALSFLLISTPYFPQILIGEFIVENATIAGVTVVPASPPAPPTPPIIPPNYENTTSQSNVTLATLKEPPTNPPVFAGAPEKEGEEKEVDYTIPVNMRVIVEPLEKVGTREDVCVRACVCACVRACMRVCTFVCVG